MYDEQVKNLRICAEGQHCDKCGKWEAKQNGGMNACQESLCTEAADAIEELNLTAESYKRSMEAWADEAANAQSRWIPVTERLPNGEAERYLVAYPLMSLGLRVSICYYADNLEEVDEYDFKDEKHSGFYWYDGEYGYCEQSGVKYWMPLPEPPKEE